MSEINYYESFKMYWVPIYKKQIKESNKDEQLMTVIRMNIRDNINLTPKQKDNIYKMLGLMPKKVDVWNCK